MEKIMTDVGVIGADPCEIFTVFELGLLGIPTHVIDSLPTIGGHCTTLYPDKPIYNSPGLPSVSGQELIECLSEQAKPFETDYHLGQQVRGLEQQKGHSFIMGGTAEMMAYGTAVILE